MMGMLVRILGLCVTLGSVGAWSQTESPAQRAKAAFDKVDSARLPALQDTMQCMQAHAALLPLVRPEERYLVHYRRGYCALFGAAVSRDANDYQEAAREFTLAWERWPARVQPVSSGLLALVGIARMGTAAGQIPAEAVKVLETAVQQGDCSNEALMQSSFCRELVDVARLWLGWVAYRSERTADAARLLGPVPGSTWNLWLAGRQAWAERRWRDGIALMEKAAENWRAAAESPAPSTLQLLGPKPDLARVYYEIGVARYRLEDYSGAVSSLNAALEMDPTNSYALFLRARAKDLQGQPDAVTDYARAAETADRTRDSSWAVGQAHYYRGLLLYRGKQFREAESAFRAAPKAGLGEIARAQVSAWQNLAAVAGGNCANAAELLEVSGQLAEGGFPVAEAQAVALGCQVNAATTLDQLLEIEQKAGGKLSPQQSRELRSRIAEAYAAEGIAAEDRKDTYVAVSAYRKAIEYNPANSKARFNLGSIYLEDKKYPLAEEQYRALVEAFPADYEAQYWLAEAILAQPLSAARKSEACELLKRSLAISDAAKKAQFSKAFAAEQCR